MDLGFTWFDFAALVVLGLSGVMAFARGLIREVFSIIAFSGAAIAAVFFAGLMRRCGEFHPPFRTRHPCRRAVIFLVVFIVITVIRPPSPRQPTNPRKSVLLTAPRASLSVSCAASWWCRCSCS